ncbi:MAG: hypothetical protein NVSMB64_06230 [Candidatus Velthaea sp.]
MAALTALDLIKSSLRLIRALGPGRGAGPAELADALLVLNSMIDSWNTEDLNIWLIQRDVYNLVAGTQTYTYGIGGVFDTTSGNAVVKPNNFERAGLITSVSGPLELPLQLINVDDWAAIPIKNVASTIPTRLYNDGAFPLATLSLWPVPSVNAQIALYVEHGIPQFATTAATVVLPPGYFDALRYNLAVQLSDEWAVRPGVKLTDNVVRLAIELKARIKSANMETQYLRCDPAVTGSGGRGFNWMTGDTV